MFENAEEKMKELAYYMFCILSSLGVCGAITFWKITTALSGDKILCAVCAVFLAFFNIHIAYTIALIIYIIGDAAQSIKKKENTETVDTD